MNERDNLVHFYSRGAFMEGRKKFNFNSILKSNAEVTITSKDFGKDYVWTSTGDSIFLRDKENKLVLYYHY